MTTSPNSVTIFSNGLADFCRHFLVKKGTPCQVSIAAKRKSAQQTGHLGDVVSSISVLSAPGSIRLTELPNYVPSPEKPALDLSGDNITSQFARKLKGAAVTLTPTGVGGQAITGRLCGLDVEDQDRGTYKTQRYFLNVRQSNGSIRRVPFENIQEINFNDSAIQSEIEKSLAYQLDQIKPDDAIVRLTMEATEKDTEAMVQYTMPVAAPKPSYRIRRFKGKLVLEGLSVVDNPTSDDWENYKVSVVTGNPITFTTDVADVRTPARGHVNIVADTTQGAVETQSLMQFAGGGALEALGSNDGTKGVRMRSQHGQSRGAVPQSLACAMSAPAASPEMDFESSMLPVASEALEVGDFSIFTTEEPVTIPARKSVVLPVFELSIQDDGESLILYYRKSENPERAMRTLRFKNTAKFSLGKGKCEVYDGTFWQGSAVLAGTKPTQTVMLPHAVETGVNCRTDEKEVQTQVTALRIAEGVLLCESTRTGATHYIFKNLKDEKFTVYIEHKRLIPHSKLTCKTAKVADTLKNGQVVFSFELPAKAEMTVVMDEQKVDSRRVETRDMMTWLRQNVVNTTNPLGNNPAIRTCVAIQEEIDGVGREIRETNTKVQNINNEQERLRKNLVASAGAGPDLETWRVRLAKSEQELVKTETETLPALQRKLETLQDKLYKALQKLSASWANED